jgi:heat shock protein HslJ
MKKLTILTLPLMFATTLALTACQTSTMPTTATNHTGVTQAMKLPLTAANLQAHHWELVSVTTSEGKRIELPPFSDDHSNGRANNALVVKFLPDGQVRFLNLCNDMWGSYKLMNNTVVVSGIASTKMMCEPDLMRLEMLAPTTLEGQFALAGDTTDPVLTVTNNKQTSVFRPVKIHKGV